MSSRGGEFMPGIDMKNVARNRKAEEANQDQDYDDDNDLDYDTEDGDEEEAEIIERPAKKIDKKIIVIAIVVALVVFLIIAYVVGSDSNNSDDTSVEDYGYTSEGYKINGDGTMTLDDGSIVEYYDPAEEQYSSEESDSYNLDDSLDSSGAETETPSNGVYDVNGNLIVDDKSGYIEPGDNDYNDGLTVDENGELSAKTSATVYSSTDFIKDLNGVNIPAVYTVKDISVVYMNVNYEKRRAIMDDGMELYWIEVDYGGKRYRCTTTFARFKVLKNRGICRVCAELLTLENGEHIISYMRVVDDNEGYQDNNN